jgi:hypothetical protein
MMICNYNEKLVEEVVKELPKEFLGEELELIAQQPILGGFRPDLIFCNKEGRIVIVEIQLNALDRHHLYKSLEYRDLYKISYNITDVQVLLLCDTIEEKYLPILETHFIQCIVFDETKFIEHFKKLHPSKKIRFKPNHIGKKTMTNREILEKLLNNYAQNNINGVFPEKTIAFWTRINGIHRSPQKTLDYQIVTVRPILERCLEAPAAFISTPLGRETVSLIFEAFLNIPFMHNIDRQLLIAHKYWLTVLLEFLEDEIYRNSVFLSGDYPNNPFLWNYDIDGGTPFSRVFEKRYSKGMDYDEKLLSDDLELLSSLTVFLGKYPDHEQAKVFTEFTIAAEPDVLNSINEGVLNRSKKKPVKISFSGISKEATVVAHYTLWHILSGHIDDHNKLDLNKTCHICVAMSNDASRISQDALKLSSNYFCHAPIKKPLELQPLHLL